MIGTESAATRLRLDPRCFCSMSAGLFYVTIACANTESPIGARESPWSRYLHRAKNQGLRASESAGRSYGWSYP